MILCDSRLWFNRLSVELMLYVNIEYKEQLMHAVALIDYNYNLGIMNVPIEL